MPTPSSRWPQTPQGRAPPGTDQKRFPLDQTLSIGILMVLGTEFFAPQAATADAVARWIPRL